jgi:hypothetical protein
MILQLSNGSYIRLSMVAQAFWWQLDDASYVELNATQSTYGGTATVALDSLAVGSHTFRAYAVDRAGNMDAAAFTHYTCAFSPSLALSVSPSWCTRDISLHTLPSLSPSLFLSFPLLLPPC